MIDERARRRATFAEGTSVPLANSQSWSLPPLSPARNDPNLEETLAAIFEAEDESEGLRGELALTILLLSRNYHLTPEDYPALLGYRPGDPAQASMRQVVHQMVVDYARSLPTGATPKGHTVPGKMAGRGWPARRSEAHAWLRWSGLLRSD